MQITDILAQTGGLQSIARELGLSEEQAASGAAALAPAILGGFQKHAQSQPNGQEGLGGLLGRLGGGGLLDQVVSPQPTNPALGNDVLGHIFGSKDVSRAVAQNAASNTGLDPSLLKRMLPLLAMVVTGYLAKQHGSAAQAAPAGGGGLGGLLGSLLGGGSSAQSSAGGLGSLLDANKDGNPLDDILRMAGSSQR
jgi:hypothetical protein